MNKNLKDYVKVYHNHINKLICEDTIEELNSVNWHTNTFVSYEKSDEKRLSDENELEVSYDNISTRGTLMLDIHRGLMDYIVKDLNFEWFNGWSGYSPIRFAFEKK